MTQLLPPNRAAELIGYSHTLRFAFDIEAIIEGGYICQALNKLGLSIEN